MDVNSACVFGIKVDSLNQPDHPFLVNMKKVFHMDASFSTILPFIAPKIAKILGLEFFPREPIQYFYKVTEQIITERKLMSHQGRNVLK